MKRETANAGDHEGLDIDPEIDAFLDILQRGGSGDFPPEDLSTFRRNVAAARSRLNPAPSGLHRVQDIGLATRWGRTTARVYQPYRQQGSALLYLHGGGWVCCSIETHDGLMRELARRSERTVVGLDYPLAPEAPFPRALECCIDAARAIALGIPEWGLKARPVALAGDSAGANLALATAVALRDGGDEIVDAVMLAYGVFDSDLDRPSYRLYSRPPLPLTREKMAWFWDQYCPDPAVRQEPLAAPLRADLVGLPPVRLIIAAFDVLRDENLEMAERLQAAGNNLTVDLSDRAPHAFLEAHGLAEVSQHTLTRAALWLDRFNRAAESRET